MARQYSKNPASSGRTAKSCRTYRNTLFRLAVSERKEYTCCSEPRVQEWEREKKTKTKGDVQRKWRAFMSALAPFVRSNCVNVRRCRPLDLVCNWCRSPSVSLKRFMEASGQIESFQSLIEALILVLILILVFVFLLLRLRLRLLLHLSLISFVCSSVSDITMPALG